MMTRLLQDNRCGRAVRARQAGFTLTELMVAITISLMITAALVAFFLNINRTNSEMAKVNVQIENGRFAIQLLQADIAHAGFWGSYVPQFDDLSATGVPADAPNAVPAPCLAYDPASWDASYKNNILGIPVQGYDAVPPGCAAVVANKKDDSDVLLVRHANTCVPGVGNCEADTAGKLYFQSSLCENEINATPALRYVLDTANFTLKKKGCTGTPPATVGTVAEKRKFVSNIYYIRDYANTVGDGIPTLVRSEFDLAHQPAVALIEGIEDFRVEFGIDDDSDAGTAVNYAEAVTWADTANRTSPTNRGDGIPDGEFVRCTTTTPCTEAQLTNVVAAKVFVLARSPGTTPGYTDTKVYQLGSVSRGPFNDRYKRHVFSTTVRLTNISGRRETP